MQIKLSLFGAGVAPDQLGDDGQLVEIVCAPAAVQRLIRGHELGHAQLKTGPAQAYEELEQQIVEVGRWRL